LASTSNARVALVAVTILLVAVAACRRQSPSRARDDTPRPSTNARARAGRSGDAVLVEVRGDVRYRAAGTVVWTLATSGMLLEPNDEVQTMSGAGARLSFADGAGVSELDADTTLRIGQPSDRDSRVLHTGGRLIARLERGATRRRMLIDLPPGTLELDSEQASPADRGGRVEARVDTSAGGPTNIVVVRGRATMRRPSATPIDIREEHYLALSATGAAPRPLEPAASATIRTRSSVSFAWAPVASVEHYRIVATRVGDATRSVTLDVDSPRAALELGSGRWTWRVQGLRNGEAMPASAASDVIVEFDQTPPPLELASPVAGAVVVGPSAAVAGRTDPGATVQVNGHAVSVASDGRFSTSAPIVRGVSNIVVRVSDDLGNARVTSRTVARE